MPADSPYQYRGEAYVQPPPPPAPPPPPPPPPPQYCHPAPQELPEHPNAAAIFVLGLLSLLTCAPLGFVAWIMGSSARAQVRAGYYRDTGLLTAGYIMGVVASLLMLIPLAVILLAVCAIAIIILIAAVAAAAC